MNHVMRAWMAAIALTVATAPTRAADLALTHQGEPVAVIVVPGREHPSSAKAAAAAKVLVDHLFQMSGARLEVRPETDLGTATVQNGHVIVEPGKLSPTIETIVLVGEGTIAQQAGFTTEGLSAGGILVSSSGNVLALIGSNDRSDPQANLHAVVACLEHLGCRYLWPGETGKVISKRATITVPPIDHRYSPRIQQRNIRIMGMSERPESGLKRLGLERPQYDAAYAKAIETTSAVTWSAWHGQSGNVGVVGGAAGAGLRGGWEEHGQAHPEWFAQQMDGSRDQSKAGERWRLCVSNRELIEHVANDIIERVKQAPNTVAISLCPNDGGFSSFCLCDECRKLDPPDAPKVKMVVFPKTGEPARQEIEVPALTDRFVHYWNAIAERVTRVHPDLLLLAEAYSYYSTPPVRERLHPNLVIRYVPSTTEGWEGWQKAGCKRIYWRPNILLGGRRDGMLHVMTTQLAEQMRYMADNGMFATDFDSIIHSWAVQGVNYYAAARLNWNPYLTADQILDDYASGGFGPAAAPIRKYLEDVQRITIQQNRAFTPESIRSLRDRLDDADKLASGDEDVLRRIAFLRTGLNYTDLHSTLDRLNAAAAESNTVADPARVHALLDLHYLTLRDIVKNHNLAINVSYLVWASGDFSKWSAIRGTGHRPSESVLALGDDRTLTGRERSIDEMLAAFGLDASLPAVAGESGPAADLKTTIDADETGKPAEVLKK